LAYLNQIYYRIAKTQEDKMELLRLIESIRTPFLDTLIGLITRLGEETIGIVILCLVFWCISKKAAYIIGIAFFLSSRQYKV